MNQQQLAPSARRLRSRRLARAGASVERARITVTWTPANDAGEPQLGPSELELTAGLAPRSNTTWTSREHTGWDWLEALSSARCSEVVLTARLDDNLGAKHLVLDLAELLTFKLSETQPLIRVLFLPGTNAQRSARSNA